MLDSDLAKLYGVETRVLNQAVKRNIERFPSNFMFQLSIDEFQLLISQNVISKNETEKRGGRQKLPNVFTEQGVAMLATILRTPVADIMSMQIIDAFVYMRKYLSSSNKDSMLVNHENRILKLEESFDKMSSKQTSIIYDGKIYDAYSIY